MVDGRAPRVQGIMMDPAVGSAAQLVQNLVRVEVEDCKQKKILVGASAVERIYTMCKEKMETNTLTPAETTPLEVSEYLIKQGLKAEIKKMITDAYAKDSFTVQRSKQNVAKDDDSAAEAALAMFKSKKPKIENEEEPKKRSGSTDETTGST